MRDGTGARILVVSHPADTGCGWGAMTVHGEGVHAGREVRTNGGVVVPGLVNLALGVPAIVPLHLAWWLLTEYLPMDCRTPQDAVRPGLANCNFTTLDHAGVVMFFLAVTGVFMLALVFAVDVILPLRRRRRLKAWLATAVLIPVPFAVCLALT
ncbi:hypothetical protein ACFV8Z_18245 [Streptomyces sp. NPDC059837]|uniref:hypothetical protein n=1 Tax=unclassified Streptomyces TaxID=2593676 RepID=UPI00365026BF